MSWRLSAPACLSESSFPPPHHVCPSNALRRILWPFLADQPLNAIYMVDTLQIAYELISTLR